jgi:hypothetical protein
MKGTEFSLNERVRLSDGRTALIRQIIGFDAIRVQTDDGKEEVVSATTIEKISRTTVLHDENHKFAPGHPKVGGGKKGYRKYQSILREQMGPFFENMGIMIEQIEDPFDRIKAIALMAKYAMPTLTAVDLREHDTRNLTAEQELMRLNAKFNGQPEPKIEDEGAQDE